MALEYAFVVLIAFAICVSAQRPAFDSDFYESVLDSEQCDRQLKYIRNNDTSLLRFRFMDASWRIPKSLLQFNTRELGNYFHCLDIYQQVLEMDIGGKYCVVQFSLDQDNFVLPSGYSNDTWSGMSLPDELPLPWAKFDLYSMFTEEMREKYNEYERRRYLASQSLGYTPDNINRERTAEVGVSSSLSFELAVCIPKVCTARQALDFFTNGVTASLTYEELFCRLPDDKPWVAADTVAVVILSAIGLITILSTAYDVRHTILQGKDPKEANQLYQSFSVYTNTKNFFFFPSGPGIVTCLDGIRALAMTWVIIGHTFSDYFFFIPENIFDIINYITEFTSVWMTSGTISVDTFFTISGILVVYTTASKVSRISLLKNLHLFYLNRFLRMFPVLAFTILFVASFLYRTADGPYFFMVTSQVNNCRAHWWTTLLYVQNFVYPSEMCLPHSWYLAIDMQLYILSPLVLFWVLGNNKRSAWIALVTVLVGVLTAASVYNFINEFQSSLVSLSSTETNYALDYYFHTLPRAAPFFVGMIYGYLLHIYREKSLRIPKILAILLWINAIVSTSLVVTSTYWIIQPDWDNQLIDNLINSYMRPIWASSIGWIVFACHNGYGGPVNWLLSLHAFKALGRLSYAMYLLHQPLVTLLSGTSLTPVYFSVHYSMLQFFTVFLLSVIAAFLVTILVDLPFTNLIKMAIGGGPKKPAPKGIVLTPTDPEITLKSNVFTDEENKSTLQYLN